MMDQRQELEKKLIFRAWHRGTREMDLLIGTFTDKYVQQFNDEELSQFIQILERSDPDIYNWITGREAPPAELNNPIMEMMKAHQYNMKETRS